MLLLIVMVMDGDGDVGGGEGRIGRRGSDDDDATYLSLPIRLAFTTFSK